jgi:hypothetical protein
MICLFTVFWLLTFVCVCVIINDLSATSRVEDGEWAAAFFAYQFMSIFFIAVAAGLCYVVPNATGTRLSYL